MSELPACYGSEKESLVELGALILGNRAAVSRPRDTATVWPSYALLLPLPGLSLSLPPSLVLSSSPLVGSPSRRPSLRVMHTLGRCHSLLRSFGCSPPPPPPRAVGIARVSLFARLAQMDGQVFEPSLLSRSKEERPSASLRLRHSAPTPSRAGV